MHPILFRIGPVALYSYGFMLVIATASAIWLARRAARRLPPSLVAISAEQVVDVVSWSLLGGIGGARALYVILNWDFFSRAPWEIPALWHGGLIWYGGFAGGVLVAWLYVRAHGLGFLRVMDQIIPFLALGHAIGRIGCFLNGCCYGKPTQAWCGVVFPGQEGPVLPAQLFEAAALFLLYMVLRRLQRPSIVPRPGRLLSVYLVAYGVLRFVMEHWRGDQPIVAAGLTLQQLISIGIVLAGLTLGTRAWPARNDR